METLNPQKTSINPASTSFHSFDRDDPDFIDSLNETPTFPSKQENPATSTLQKTLRALKQKLPFRSPHSESLYTAHEQVPSIEILPVENYLNHILTTAINFHASDIHFEPQEAGLRIRYRKDGELQLLEYAPQDIACNILNRLKLLCKKSSSINNSLQDGRFEYSSNNQAYDMRATFSPSYWGETAVLRVLDKVNRQKKQLHTLGFQTDQLKLMQHCISRSDGLILACGPTGCGKTTTLYAILETLNERTKKIITIEDPVEYQLKGINQVNINSKTDLTFANSLRAILRQSPDIILVGEIRDAETAAIAINAALTGHLVLSTIHATDTPTAITRLLDLGVPHYLIASALKFIFSQRLIRTLCTHCKTERPIKDHELALFQTHKLTAHPFLYEADGCPACNNKGLSGRTAVFELLDISPEITQLIHDKAPIETIRKHLQATLFTSSLQKVIEGSTTLSEVLSEISFKE